jgi:hypothetical protein
LLLLAVVVAVVAVLIFSARLRELTFKIFITVAVAEPEGIAQVPV